jgi:ABC-type lipoprotein export system ATPase subunit
LFLPDPNVAVEQADKPQHTVILHNINMRIKRGCLTAVVGSVGSGKSSLVMACLGEMIQVSAWMVSILGVSKLSLFSNYTSFLNQVEGQRHCLGPVGLVSQTAWIQNMTVRDNILFGSPYNEAKYQQVGID